MALVEAVPHPQSDILQTSHKYKTKRAFPIFDNAHKDSQLNNVVTGEAGPSQEDAVVEHTPIDPQLKEEATVQADTSPVIDPVALSSSPDEPQGESPQADSSSTTGKTGEAQSSSGSAATNEPKKPKRKRTTKHDVGVAVTATVGILILAGLLCVAAGCVAGTTTRSNDSAPIPSPIPSNIASTGGIFSGSSTSLAQHQSLAAQPSTRLS